MKLRRSTLLTTLAVLIGPGQATAQDAPMWVGILYRDSLMVPAFEFREGAWRGVEDWDESAFPETWYYHPRVGDPVALGTGERLNLREGGWVLPIDGSVPVEALTRGRDVLLTSRPLGVGSVGDHRWDVILWSLAFDAALPLLEAGEEAYLAGLPRSPSVPPPAERSRRPAVFTQLDLVWSVDATAPHLLRVTLVRSYDRAADPGCPWILQWQGWLARDPRGSPPEPVDAGETRLTDCDMKEGRRFEPLGAFRWRDATYVAGWASGYEDWRPELYQIVEGRPVLVARGPDFGY